MRNTLALAAILAVTPALADAPARPRTEDFDVPRDKGPQHVRVFVYDFRPGVTSGWHTHAGPEIAFLVSGEMLYEQEGQPARRLSPGDSFQAPRGVAHNVVSTGKVPAKLAITFVVDKDAPQSTPAPGH